MPPLFEKWFPLITKRKRDDLEKTKKHLSEYLDIGTMVECSNSEVTFVKMVRQQIHRQIQSKNRYFGQPFQQSFEEKKENHFLFQLIDYIEQHGIVRTKNYIGFKKKNNYLIF